MNAGMNPHGDAAKMAAAVRQGEVINRSYPPAEADAFLVKQMKAAGAVLVGALNMDVRLRLHH